MDVSVIIVTFNSADSIQACLDSVRAQTGVTSEIIVVDNASSDGTAEIARTAGVQVVANPENVGYGRANNQGVAASRGQHVHLLNPDSILVETTGLSRLCHALETQSHWGMAGNRILSADGTSETHPSTGYPAQRHVHRDFSRLPGRIAWVSGASMIIRRRVYDKLGGFDPSFFLYSEETDLCLRLRELGYEIGFVEDVTVRHRGGGSEQGGDPYAVCERKMNGLLLFRQKHYPVKDWIRLARRDWIRARLRNTWYRFMARFQAPRSIAWSKHRQYSAIADVSRHFLISKTSSSTAKGPASSESSFLERARHSQNIMVLDLGFLGDTIHLLPALWMIRQACPNARLHAAVADHVVDIMRCVPWVDRVWGYPRFPRHATLRQNIRFITGLRSEQFDVLINLNGSDRSSWLSFLSGARFRLGRIPSGGGPPFWRSMFTDFVQYPFLPDSMYLQRCRCLEQAGFAFSEPEFHVETDEAVLGQLGISAADRGTFFHVSPFTTADKKELSREQMVELLVALQKQWPQKRWIISTAPTERERVKLDQLLKALPWKPWKAFSGSLDLMPALIQHSALHLSGDTGMRHVALMTGTPSVVWFRPFSGMEAWIPATGPHRTLFGTDTEPDFLHGIKTADLVKAVCELLDKPRCASASPDSRQPEAKR
ncbi:MAG TPA: glycosyltransferase [Verrucomicrobiae bacterium]|nr:glycosyltransferase [Verrucomicrobiae bacterium]